MAMYHCAKCENLFDSDDGCFAIETFDRESPHYTALYCEECFPEIEEEYHAEGH